VLHSIHAASPQRSPGNQMLVLRRFAGLLLLAIFFLQAFTNPCFAEDPLFTKLVQTGIKVREGKSVPLTAPTLRDGMSADEQQAAIRALANEVGEERFLKESAVSPFVMEIKSVEKLDSGGELQRVDIWFVAYGTIDSILDKKLFADLAVPTKPAGDGPADESRELTQEELTKYQLTQGELPDGTRSSFGYLGFTLFDKVRLSLVTHAQSQRSPESLVLMSQMQEGITELPCTWSPLSMDADDKVTIGKAQPYNLAASYVKVTELKFQPKGLLIEMHILFAEPQEWFNGRNMLRSKLPPVIQDGLRKFRRKLAQ
jgi:hypothetical protein